MLSRIVIAINLVLYISAFITRNIITRRNTGQQVQIPSLQVVATVILSTLLHLQALAFALSPALLNHSLPLRMLDIVPVNIAGYIVLILSQLIGVNALIRLGDSWRVGIKESQKTELVTGGIYKISRNPYFLSYLLMYLGYLLIFPNLLTAILIVASFIFIHWMILKEESYLERVQGQSYVEYKRRTGRYLLWF